MKIDLLMLRKELNKTQAEMAQLFGISRVKYSEAEKLNWIEDRYIYEHVKKGLDVIVPPNDFFDYTSYSLVLNMLVQNMLAENGDAEEASEFLKLTQTDVAEALGITQPYISILLSRFTCLYDRKGPLSRMFQPFFQPFVLVENSEDNFRRYVNDIFVEKDSPVIVADSHRSYSSLAVMYNLKMCNKSRRDLARFLGISMTDLSAMLNSNVDMGKHEEELKSYFQKFLVPFYKKMGQYIMVEAGVNLHTIVSYI